ncbi:MAG: maleylpyruvate isomerase N-terminal domain-containing protein, partial [Sciscionella sp.]
FWARRMAHDTAIHRLDAEHARVGRADPASVPTLLFDPAFAADGIDELLCLLVPIPHPAKNELTAEGTILFHAADAGQAWELRLVPGQAPTCGAAEGSGTNADATVAGTADAVFRAAWKRPSGALVSGNAELLTAVPTP